MMSWKGKAGTKVPAGIEPLTSESNDTGIHNSVQPSQAISTPYDRIQDLKKRLSAAGVKVTIGDLLAMTRKNDPFIAGQPYQVKQAQWFADLCVVAGANRRLFAAEFQQ